MLSSGAKLALSLVNSDPYTLPNHTLELLIADTKCEYDTAVSNFISMVIDSQKSHTVGILGNYHAYNSNFHI